METKIENMSQLISEEYETQLFGFSARSLFEQMQNMVFTQIKESAKCMEKAMIKKCGPLSTEEEGRIIGDIDNLIKTHINNSSSAFFKIKELINDNFKIPKNVILPEDAVQQNKSTEEEITKLKNEISKLESRIMRAKSLMAYCDDELSEFEKNEEVFNKFKEIATSIEQAETNIDKCHTSDLICELNELSRPTSIEDTQFYDNAVKYLS